MEISLALNQKPALKVGASVTQAMPQGFVACDYNRLLNTTTKKLSPSCWQKD
jgi:hypothetical protein